jgi:hypothetical protein
MVRPREIVDWSRGVMETFTRQTRGTIARTDPVKLFPAYAAELRGEPQLQSRTVQRPAPEGAGRVGCGL